MSQAVAGNQEPQDVPEQPAMSNPFMYEERCSRFDEHSPQFALQTICFFVKKNELDNFAYQLKNLSAHHLKDGIWK